MKQDIEFALDIGKKERHRLLFRWKQFPGAAQAWVDGDEVLYERHFAGTESTRRYEVSVGAYEKHTVIIEKTKPEFFGGLRKQAFEVLVDGNPVGVY
jgi:hypothetical protein